MGLLRLLPFLAAGALLPGAGPAYRTQMEKFRAAREASLKAEGGWLSVAGLFWLKEGVNRIGAGKGNGVELPAGAAPASVGVLTLRGGVAAFEPVRGASVTLDGQPLKTRATLRPDGGGQTPSTIGVGRLQLLCIRRGERFAIRLKDNESELRRNFAGIRWFPVNPEWRFEARFEPKPGGSTITMESVAGTKDSYESAGFAVFEKGGKQYKLEAVRSGERLWFVFRDGTSGKTTYAGARQLYTDPPKAGRVIVDFNQAINLPCAFNPWTICPLPPPQNRLTLAIEAGEMDYRPR